MIRPAATLLALLATFAAAPAQAQQSAPATPLPALLQPDSGAWRQSTVLQTPISGPLRGAIIGMGVGCVLLGALWVTTDSDAGARETVGSRTVSTEPVEINPERRTGVFAADDPPRRLPRRESGRGFVTRRQGWSSREQIPPSALRSPVIRTYGAAPPSE